MARVSDAHLEARRQSILAAATKVFSQKGIAAATMAEIASEAGISPGAIYRYLENKEQLATGCMNESAEAIKSAWENPGALEMNFEELASLTFENIDAPGEAIDTQMFLEQGLIAVRDGNKEAMAQFRDEHRRVREGIRFLMAKQYGDRLTPFDVDKLSDALYSFYWGARLLKLLVPDLEPTKQFEAVSHLMTAAFGVAPPSHN
jgi:AcrR family transcriptional regulator